MVARATSCAKLSSPRGAKVKVQCQVQRITHHLCVIKASIFSTHTYSFLWVKWTHCSLRRSGGPSPVNNANTANYSYPSHLHSISAVGLDVLYRVFFKLSAGAGGNSSLPFFSPFFSVFLTPRRAVGENWSRELKTSSRIQQCCCCRKRL